MTQEAKEALLGSIAKWQAIVDGTGVDRRSKNCPLCKLFLDYSLYVSTCQGCPVSERTGQDCCRGTPYERFALRSKYYSAGHFIPKTDAAKAAARDMLDFLKSLLPKQDAHPFTALNPKPTK